MYQYTTIIHSIRCIITVPLLDSDDTAQELNIIYYVQHSTTMCMCMYSIPLLDAIHTHTLPPSLCVACMWSVPLLDTTHTRGLLQLIYCVIHSIPLLDTVYNTIDVVCYYSPVCMYSIPLLDTIHTQCVSITHCTRSLWYSITQELHAPMTMCVCIASPCQMLCIHTQCAVMCDVPLLDNTHNSTGGVCGGYAHRSFTHSGLCRYYVGHPLIRWHT